MNQASSPRANPASVAAEDPAGALGRLLADSALLVALVNTEGAIRHLNPALHTLFPAAESLADLFSPWSAAQVRERGLPLAISQGLWEASLTLNNGERPTVVQATFAAPGTGEEVLALLTPHTPASFAEAEEEEAVPDLSSRLAIPLYHETRFLAPASIHFLEAQGSYTLIHTDGDNVLTSLPLASFSPALPDTFIRVHRSFIVNIRHIHSVFRRESRLFLQLEQEGSQAIPVSRRRERAIRAILDTANKLKATTR